MLDPPPDARCETNNLPSLDASRRLNQLNELWNQEIQLHICTISVDKQLVHKVFQGI